MCRTAFDEVCSVLIKASGPEQILENISGAEGGGIWKNRINGLFLKAVLGGCHARGLSKGDAEAVLALVTAGKSDVLDRACGGSEIIPGTLQTDGGKILVWGHTSIFFKLANEVGGIQRQVVCNLLHSERALEILLYIVERALYGIAGIRRDRLAIGDAQGVGKKVCEVFGEPQLRKIFLHGEAVQKRAEGGEYGACSSGRKMQLLSVEMVEYAVIFPGVRSVKMNPFNMPEAVCTVTVRLIAVQKYKVLSLELAAYAPEIQIALSGGDIHEEKAVVFSAADPVGGIADEVTQTERVQKSTPGYGGGSVEIYF